jgi:Mn2+/Fe2+ NRAMP family transporter
VQAGAQYGLGLLWVNTWTLPLLFSVQVIAARLGNVTGAGLAAGLRRHFGRRVALGAVAALALANVVNIAADLAAMGAVLRLLLGGPEHGYLAATGLAVVVAQVVVPYRRFAILMKWLALSLLSYVVLLFFARVDWSSALSAIVIPAHGTPWLERDFWVMLVAVTGTTMSPYMLFWQASQEVEERATNARHTPHAGHPDLGAARIHLDTLSGMGFSALIAVAVMLAGAAVLQPGGTHDVRTVAQAAEAMRPLAGEHAYALFSLGVVATGLLAVPILAGSTAYAVCEALGWKRSLDAKVQEATGFYALIAVATLAGVALDFVGVDPIKALVYAAVLNGLLAPPLLALMMVLATRAGVIGSGWRERLLLTFGWMAVTLMTVALGGVLWTALTA